MTPLKFCDLLFKVDIECVTKHIEKTHIYTDDYKESNEWHQYEVKEIGWIRPLGTTAQSGAIRLALSRALRSFVSRDVVEKMRLAGLLTMDGRVNIRKRYGKMGANRPYTWKKR
jgi:ribosomal protein S9